MSISDRLDKWLTDSEEVLIATHDGFLDPEAFTDGRGGQALAALRAVLDLHPKGAARAVAGTGGRDIEHCLGCRGAHGIAHDEHGLVHWPCPTVRAIANTLGEES